MSNLYEEVLELREFYKRGGNTISNSLNIEWAVQQLSQEDLPVKEVLEALVKLCLIENLSDLLKKETQ